LADELAAEIDAGRLEDGQRVPSESQSQREHGLSRGTVRAAVKLLQQRGVAYTIQGRGTYVGQPPAK
jgi:GntR family transcriptional regulator/GntR family mannosyl-D-glycerate transport/metabolism transcriptional repressor